MNDYKTTSSMAASTDPNHQPTTPQKKNHQILNINKHRPWLLLVNSGISSLQTTPNPQTPHGVRLLVRRWQLFQIHKASTFPNLPNMAYRDTEIKMEVVLKGIFCSKIPSFEVVDVKYPDTLLTLKKNWHTWWRSQNHHLVSSSQL